MQTLAYIEVPWGTVFSTMGTKLVKLDVPDDLHRRIKTIAAYHDKKIPVYVLEVLEESVPKQIVFEGSEPEAPKDVKQKKSQGKVKPVEKS
jgi:hypothetical protein